MSDPYRSRREKLIDRYGKPGQGNPVEATERLGLDVSPSEMYVSVFRDQEAADGWMTANLEDFGHPSLGTYLLDTGQVVGVLDLRPALRKARGD